MLCKRRCMEKSTKYTPEDLTIVICAYGECQALGKSVSAIVHQSVCPRILLSTSTPNDFIMGVAKKYGIPVRINPTGGHVKDYNFALRQVETPLGMLAHQDDILHPRFVEKSLKALNRASHPILSFTNYLEMVDGKVCRRPSPIILIKRLLVWPMEIPFARRTVLMKRIGQCLGNPITHPTVICVMKELPEEIFREKYRASMDWDLWERLSRKKGEFVYVRDVLLYHRMDKDNATAQLIRTTNARYDDEYEIMSRFWPKPLAKLIMCAYSQSARFY